MITSPSRGIGLATTMALGNAGHTVHATMRDPAGALDLTQTAEKEELPIYVSAVDVDSDASDARAFRATEKVSGPLDVLVNSAGIEWKGSSEELEPPEVRAVMGTNYFAGEIQFELPGMSGCAGSRGDGGRRRNVSP